MIREDKKNLDSCVFCREQDGSKDTNFARIYPELGSRVLLESDSISIFPCIGQLTPNHSLIITKQHFNTFAQAFNYNACLDNEVSILISKFKRKYVKNYEKLLIFEHGALCSTQGGCGIYHSHIHLVPVITELPIFSLYEFTCAPKKNLIDCFNKIDPASSYVLAGYYGKELFIEQQAEPLPSQYLRQKLALQLNNTEWDWRKYQRQPSLTNMLNL